MTDLLAFSAFKNERKSVKLPTNTVQIDLELPQPPNRIREKS